ncbi:RE1-silencing transcription factor isoform X2 [Tachyglossus aculeatus]|nr:RE1-silencing transcription factor isoform X2 [Tachyglossus aculeatus]XP_038614814.1 RE1-silencing transcription factor isoform X2 [Tachyglossus aculeatus]XP_038614815.1 RE1-silencing transcription factor isoform X2 [Tachyglossus aculeatus]XP_038614816.1 RE1-silencing transcription factor isoform X2 [Tachyglossus aculeatus]
MATQVLGQSGGGGLFPGNANMGMALPSDTYDLHDLSKAELAAPQLIMLANVALTGDLNGGCCDYLVGEERQMAELTTVGDSNFSDSDDGEGLEGTPSVEDESGEPESMELGALEVHAVEPQATPEAPAVPEGRGPEKDLPAPAPDVPESTEDKAKSSKSKPFRCRPCQYEAESEEEFVHHIRVHSAKKFIVEENAEKQAQAKEADPSVGEEADFSKGPIRCERCGYNTNRYDHYLAHLKHHNKAGENERVYKCSICTYTTVSEYHWKKHLRNHFPRKVYTCSQCSYFSDRKNNYIQHIRTHTGERPYQCGLCPYSSSQKTHLTRHMRTHSGEKPFKCDQCIYVASNQHEVTRHARQVHNGPKPLTCPHCDYKTADRSNFKKHVELHVNPRQFLCPVCDYAASKKCNLQYHIKSRHPGCSSITMDVSKVKLRTKKSEAEPPDAGGAGQKADREQTREAARAKPDAMAEKRGDKATKGERKESASRDRKAGVGAAGAGQVTTRSRKATVEGKETDGAKPDRRSEKPAKSKKTKRKAEEAAASGREEPLVEAEPVAKKKKKGQSRPPDSPRATGEVKVEEQPKKPNAGPKKSKKKKALKNKGSRKSGKPTEGKCPEEPPPEKSTPAREDRKGRSGNRGLAPLKEPMPTETSPSPGAKDDAAPGDLHCLSPLPGEGGAEDKDQEEQMPTELGGDEGQDATPEKAVEKEPGDESFIQSPAPGSQECPEVPPTEWDLNATCRGDEEAPLLPQTPPPPPQPPASQHRLDPGQARETETETEVVPEPAQDVASRGGASDRPLQPTPESCQPAPGAATAVGEDLSSSGQTAEAEPQEMDEDEGIHSHDGSDLSDNMSEGSDDSGLNGARSVQEEVGTKAGPEEPPATGAEENFVCIFCDRSFRKEREYSKHLHRHLVNVYYLEKAAEGQE